MAKIHNLPSLDQAKREASEWIARLDADAVSEVDSAEFEQWRSASALNARAFEDLSSTYREFVAAGSLVRAVSFAQSMNEAARTRRGRRWPALAAMAAVLLLIAGGAVYLSRSAPPTYRTGVGEHATIALPDGSTLELNSASSARVEYEPKRRVIHLERGEAYFKVSPDLQRPFWVVAGTSSVRALGTAFDVYLKEQSVQITVSEGTVKVGSSRLTLGTNDPSSDAGGSPTAVLQAGEEARVQGASTATRPLSSTELARAVSWREGTLYFENQSLSEVSSELERYSTIHFILQDEAVRQLRLGGTFQASPQGAETLIAMLEHGFGLKVQRQAGRVYLETSTPRAPPSKQSRELPH